MAAVLHQNIESIEIVRVVVLNPAYLSSKTFN